MEQKSNEKSGNDGNEMMMNRKKLFLRRFCLLATFILLVGCSKATDQELWDKLNIAMDKEKDDLQVNTLEIIEELVKRNNNQIKQPEFMDRFTAIVLGKIDFDANWLSVNDKKDDRALVMERILKRMDSSVLLTSMGKKITETQSRKKALALSEKYNINGYEGYFLTIFSNNQIRAWPKTSWIQKTRLYQMPANSGWKRNQMQSITWCIKAQAV